MTHRSVLSECSQEDFPGEIMAIMQVRARGLMKLSRSTWRQGGGGQGGELGVVPIEGQGQEVCLRQLGGPKRRVAAFPAQGADALLQGQKALVDLCPFHPGGPVCGERWGGCGPKPRRRQTPACARPRPGLTIGVGRVGPALVAGQIDEGELAVQLSARVPLPQNDLRRPRNP
jgi:hypothetical protein